LIQTMGSRKSKTKQNQAKLKPFTHSYSYII
jgi:hypothetical protein